MALSNYTELQAAIADQLTRSDLTTNIVDFITLAEARMNRVLRTRDMETSAAGTFSSGTFSLPADYLEWISLQWTNVRSQDLRYAEPNSERWSRRFRPNGDPQMFTILGGSVRTRPSAGSGSYTFYYYQKIPALASNSTNWLLTRAPELYYYTALAEAHAFLKDEARAAQYLALANLDLQKANSDADSNKVSRRSASRAEEAADAAATDAML